MKKIRIRKTIEIHEDKIIIDPRRRGTEVEATVVEGDDPVTRFDKAREKVIDEIKFELSQHREKIQRYQKQKESDDETED